MSARDSKVSMPVVLAMLAFCVTVVVRLLFVNSYYVDMPFLDQWSAELEHLYLPYVRGELKWTDLFALHNEHRLVFTRLLSLALFIVHGSWSPRFVGQVQTVMPALLAALLVYWNARDLGVRASSVALIVAVFALPLAVTSAIWSFQSQFGFLILFSIMAIRLASSAPISFARFLGVGLFSVFAFLSMAGGALTPLVCAGLLGLRSILSGKDLRLLLMSILLMMLAVVLYSLVPASGGLGAHSVSQFIMGVGELLLWPRGAGAFIWLPAAVLLFALIRREPRKILVYLFPIGLYSWTLLMVVALAARRGELVHLIYSHQKIFDRYVDLLLPAFIGFCYLVDTWELDAPKQWLKSTLHPRLLKIGLVLALAVVTQLDSFERGAFFRGVLTNNRSQAREALSVSGPWATWSLRFHDDPARLLELLIEARAAGILPALSAAESSESEGD